ncbi:hypothetical protein CH361_13030 [Leptospira brenneri]|nr:hypothetical protein CH361_13030 [Leptospira brenneri]
MSLQGESRTQYESYKLSTVWRSISSCSSGSGYSGVRVRSRPSDQALRILLAGGVSGIRELKKDENQSSKLS